MSFILFSDFSFTFLGCKIEKIFLEYFLDCFRSLFGSCLIMKDLIVSLFFIQEKCIVLQVWKGFRIAIEELLKEVGVAVFPDLA